VSRDKWIQKALAGHKTGQLHRDLGVPVGQKIPVKKLDRAAERDTVVGQRARLAKTLKGF